MTMRAKLLRVPQKKCSESVERDAINCRVLAATTETYAKPSPRRPSERTCSIGFGWLRCAFPRFERREDISLLAHYFLDKYRAEFSKDVRRLHPATLSMLETMD